MNRVSVATRLSAVFLGFVATALGAPSASADPMDPTVHRLGVVSPTDLRPCSVDGTNITVGSGVCAPDNATFQRLALQLGNSIASAGLSPARTVGYRHFYLGAEVAFTRLDGIDASAPPTAVDDSDATRAEWDAFRERNYLRLATEGGSLGASPDPADQAARYRNGNRFAASTYSWTRLAFRKGLPLGLEIGGSVGRILDTGMWAFSFEVKWALFEGFRRRWPAIFPDLAVRGAVTTLTGLRGFTLTVPTFDVTLSKGFVLAHSVTVTPYVAGQLVWIMADSEVVDVTPGNLADNDGERSLVTFDRIREWHPRIRAGLQLQYTRFVLNGAFRTDLGNPARGMSAIGSMPKQWAIDVGVGVVY